MIRNFGIFLHLLKKMSGLVTHNVTIQNWMHSDKLYRRVVSIATEVCQQSMGVVSVDQESIQHGWDIISIVLSSEEGNKLDIGVLSGHIFLVNFVYMYNKI